MPDSEKMAGPPSSAQLRASSISREVIFMQAVLGNWDSGVEKVTMMGSRGYLLPDGNLNSTINTFSSFFPVK